MSRNSDRFYHWGGLLGLIAFYRSGLLQQCGSAAQIVADRVSPGVSQGTTHGKASRFVFRGAM